MHTFSVHRMNKPLYDSFHYPSLPIELIPVADGRKDRRRKLSSIATSARSRSAARGRSTGRPAAYTGSLSRRCARCISARADEEWQSRQLGRHRESATRKSGSGNCVPTVASFFLSNSCMSASRLTKADVFRLSARVAACPAARADASKCTTLPHLCKAQYNSYVKRLHHPVCYCAFNCVR
jgi:hypothetical protein